MTVQERIDLLRKIGVEIFSDYKYVGEVGTPERHKEDVPGTFYSFQAPFSAEEWLSIAQNEGDNYMGGCCGNMSALQDEISSVFRLGGGIGQRELSTIAHYALGHDGFESFDPMTDEQFKNILPQFDKLNPWDKLGVIYNAVAPAIDANSKEERPYRSRPDEEGKEGERLISQLYRGLGYRNWSDLFEVREDKRGQHEAQRKLDLAKIYPLVVRLKDFLEEVDLNFEGFAVVDADKEIVSNGYGICIYPTKEEGLEVVELSDAKLSVVPCRVSREEGLVLDVNI